MTFHELCSMLHRFGLEVIRGIDENTMAIVKPGIANPIILFNPYESDYRGTVSVKAINALLFHPDQIQGVLVLIHEFLKTPLEARGLDE